MKDNGFMVTGGRLGKVQSQLRGTSWKGWHLIQSFKFGFTHMLSLFLNFYFKISSGFQKSYKHNIKNYHIPFFIFHLENIFMYI